MRGKLNDADLRLLRVLDAVLETRDVTRASEILSVTPSAVSHSLRLLRALFDDPLMVRTRGRFEPTPRALALQPALRHGLAQLAALVEVEPEFDPATSRRRFSLATPDYQLFVILPMLVARVREIAPQVDLRFRPLAADVLDQLATGALDLVIAGAEVEAALALDREVMRSRIIAEPFCCVLREDHPAAQAATLSLEAYVQAPHVVVSMTGEDSDQVDSALAARGLRRRVAATVPSFMAAAWYATSSDMIATLPRTVALRAAARNQGVVRPPPLALPRSIAYLWWHPRFQSDAGHGWWRKALFDVFAPYRD
ncbi:LysR family transcriptional regulator [Sphingomonas morindae]|uniref:LysR family transcriptional regulator n=1 Tax=Sphingomonas morindae TaxID=1541170 RepID=A0ABY4XE19_9SPHN|nr:LysR family transcriptional regulator [Sphingomonas morindae]USI74945.1 LysR family transcriptional regulator [Sphingomonas morindae]